MIVSVAEVIAVIAVIVSAAIVAAGLTLDWATRRLAQRREARAVARRAEAAARPARAQPCEPPTADGIDAVEAELDAIERLVLGDRPQAHTPAETPHDSLPEVEVLRLAEDTVTAAIRITRDAVNERGNR